MSKSVSRRRAVSLAVRTAGVGAEPLEGRRLFAQLFPGEVYGVGLNPAAVISTDFNGDGRADLATANQDAADQGSVSILLGRGDGTFAAGTAVLTGGAPASVKAADFNGDGKIDLVTADTYANTVSIALGAGDGTFAVPVSYDAGALNAVAVVTGDFNGDGKIDVAVSSDNNSATAAGTVSVLLGAGDGTLGAAATFATGARPLSIATGDFNGDGKADLVTANANASGTLSVLSGVGNGTFAAATTVTVGAQPQAVVVADFNGDNKIDVATANLGGTVTIRRGNGDGTFAAAVTVTAGTTTFGRARSLVATDFDLDGDLDLLVAGGTVAGAIDGRVFVLTNTAGTLARTAAYVTGFDPASIAAADFNGDARPDVATTAFKGNNASVAPFTAAVTVLVSGATGQLVASRAYSAPDRPRNIAYGYINGDDRLDLVTANLKAGTASIFYGNGDGTFARGGDVFIGNGPNALALGDFNRDGKTDLVTTSSDPRNGEDTVELFWGNGSGGFSNVFFAIVEDIPNDIQVGDFNNDGRSDLAVAKFGGGVTVLLGNAGGTFNTPTSYATGTNPNAVAIADLNLDGKQDLIVANQLSGSLSVLYGVGNGTFAAAISVGVGGAPIAVSVADFNRDGRPDLAVGNFGGSVSVLRNNANGTFTRTTTPVGTGVSDIVTGDFTGDGRADVAATDSNTGLVTVLPGNGDGTFAPKRGFAVDIGVYAIDAADFNGDGKTDLFASSIINTPDYCYVTVLLNQSPSPYVGIAYDVLTISGTTQSILVGLANGNLTIDTPAGPVTVAAAGIRQIVLNGVNVTFTSDLGPAGGNGTIGLTIDRTSTATFGASQHLTNLTVNGTAMVAASGGKLLRTAALTFGAAGQLDLTDNALLYDYSGTTPQVDSIAAKIKSGRANGAWTGLGLTSSSAKNNPAANTTLGYLDASDYQTLNGPTATFYGEGLDGTAVLVRYTLYGDTDLDRGVSMMDFNRLSANFGQAGGLTWLYGDLDNDGSVSILDFLLLSANYGKTLAGPIVPPAVKTGVAPAKR